MIIFLNLALSLLVMTKKELAILLSRLQVFKDPNPLMEQYPTDSEVAASLLWTAFMNKHIEGKTVLDLGCGTGILGIGALMLGASRVLFVDSDGVALWMAESNLRACEEHATAGDAEFVNYDIGDFFTPADVVVMNPPFGTRSKGADIRFLERAMQLSPIIYSIHKASTKDFLDGYVANSGYCLFYEECMLMPLNASMRHHNKRIQRIEVACLGMRRLV